METILYCYYIDVMLVAGSIMEDINALKRKLANSFVIKDLGTTKKILGVRIKRDRKNHKLALYQSDYIKKVLKYFKCKMQN